MIDTRTDVINASTNIVEILRLMAESDRVFTLTGSQFFFGRGQDIDFISENLMKTREFLEGLHFKEINGRYSDKCIVMERSGTPKIHVQLWNSDRLNSVLEVNNFLRANTWLLDEHYKDYNKKVWESLYNLARISYIKGGGNH